MKRNLIAAAAVTLLTHAAMAQVPPPPVSPTPVTTYEYDAEGNPTKVTKAPSSLNLQNKASYDAQYRVKELTDPKNGKTAIEYDGGGRPTKVIDPRNLVTQYPRNGFGDATQLISPDTGITNVTYDSARNLKTLTDSRGVTQTYTYDELNRVTSVVYTQSGQPSQTITWTWDLTGPDYPYSIGRLSRTDHPSGFARVKYDPRGRITEAVQSVNAKAGANTVPIVTTVKYAYSHGDLMTITYPSGRVLVITRDVGELIGMSLSANAGGTPIPLISNVKWEPFGPVSGWDWHMTSGLVTHMRQFDLSGRIVRYPLGNALRDVTYDAADRITGFTHLLASDGIAQPALDQSFGYDENSRLTSITTAASSWSIAYDPNGNRTSVSLNGSPSIYTTEATSNRLTSITNPARSFGYDNAGNTTSDSAGYTASYGLNGSIASITKAGVTGSYDYDAERRRIRKVTSTGETVIFVYDLEGQLLGEYDQTGKPLREYVWLDNIPVAMFMPDPANASNPNAAPLVFYIHADHLNAPRIVVDQNGAKRWRWLAEPFGTTAPETNPEGLGVFTQNLRFPGQYADAESGLWYNHFRYLDSSKGRYTQSDPAGLVGGINTFAYVDGNPLMLMDPNGLWSSADLPSLPDGLVNFFTGFGSYYGGLWNASKHMYQRAGFAGECRQRRAIENEAALAGGLLALSNPTIAANAVAQLGNWAANHKAYLAGRLSAGGVTSTVTRTGPYGGISLGLIAGLGDALENIDRADASSAEHVLRGILGDRLPDLPDVHRTECECKK
ncbi:RHS repeat domain-containing protein [Rhizobacter sp. OV335]|uniref:RHS repeat domain-containing protein n=1 Tax=Rhizobacter sp. OV335 TaxID=1500264 RepID=UPI000935D8F1|nr:RHS repeat-associated core domain-containing protein [Rhizobacter sp. OV335]